MKAKVAYKVTSLIVAFMVAVFTVGYAFAWLFDKRDANLLLSGASAGAYFDSTSGNGESAEFGENGKGPFVIANATHMRNLAVLQNTGRFVDADGNPKKYYFEIKKSIDEIDMTAEIDNLWIPPIGNDDHPFIGEFNGNGKTIKNLKVTTDKTLLTKEMYPTQASETYEFSNAVGLFGNTKGTDCKIRNFILDNPVLLVGSTANTKYKGGNKVVGLAVGHVEGLCQSIGVRANSDKETYLQIADTNTKYSTFNSILGELGEGVESSVTGGGHTAGTGGSGAAFGSSFDVEDLLLRLEKIDANKKSDAPSWRLPRIDNQNTNPVPHNLRQVAFSVTEESTYEGEDAREVISNQNIGYFLGNQNKIMTSKELKFDPPMTLSGNEWVMSNTSNVPRWFYTYKKENGWYDTMDQAPSYGKTVFAPLTQSEFDELPQGIIDLLPAKVGDKESFTAVRLSEVFNNTQHPVYNNGIGGWSFHGQISIMGKTYGKGLIYQTNEKDDAALATVIGEDGTVAEDMIKYGSPMKFYEYEGGIYLPNNAVWFKPQQAGKIKFVMYAESKGEGFALVKITRNGATKENPFYSAPNTTSWGYGEDIDFTPIMRTSLPSGVLLYFEHEVDSKELAANNVEYMLMQYGSAGAQFLYLDLGASAAEDTSAVVPDKVSAVDFIYDGVEITQEDVDDTDIKIGDFIVNASGTVARYDSSKTSIYFENLTAALKIVYVRLHNETGKHAGKTICLEKSDPVPDTNSEVHATFATYVCPTISGGSGTVGGGGGTVTPTPDAPTLTVTNTSLELTVGGGTQKINASASSGATISYKSNNESVVTVANDGTVTVVGAGSTTITVTATDDNGKTATKTVSVSVAPAQITDTTGTYTYTISNFKPSVSGKATDNSISVTGLSSGVLEGNVSEDTGDFKFTSGYTVTITLNAKAGQTVSVNLTGFTGSSNGSAGIQVAMTNATMVSASNEIEFSATSNSSNIENGTVEYTVTANGEIVITLTRGSQNRNAKLTNIEVVIGDGSETPTPTPATVTEVTLNSGNFTLGAGGTKQLNATVTMSDGSAYSGSVVWTSSDTSVATVDANGLVTAASNLTEQGTATITATAGGKSANVTVTVNKASSGDTYESWSIDFNEIKPSGSNTNLKDGDVLVENALTVKTSSNSNINTGGYLKGNTDGVLELKVEADAVFTYTCANKNSARTLVIKNADGETVHSQAMDNESHTVNLSAGTYTITFLGGVCRISSFVLTY